ncbi:SDR family oxidoreductase [Haladaptatus halobius]|uniref:SDR family oxidoreductase n=1 Tax=Haladaptatus halobius TaxID=2884875 RepID=UPI001D09F4B6|nr:SDR family oxidoreductase [Haladaptatus halobius]
MDYGIEGTVALVTASSSGLGKGSAMALAREGVHVVVNGRDREKLAHAVADIESVAKGDVIGRPGDITDPDDLTALVDDTVEEFGRLDHLVTSAGGPPRHSFFELTDEHWYDNFDMLVMSVVRLVREAAPYLRRDGGGSIVNITSLVVKEASPSNPLSSSIRMATMGLEKCLSYQLAPEVRVNAVLPGLFDTPRRNDPGSARVEPSDVPAGRLGEAIELGEVVAFLCSEAAGYLTGASIPVDGGALESTL